MDQIYISKNRTDFSIGSYVIIKQLKQEKITEKPYFYNLKNIEPIKVEIINRIFNIINKTINDYENIIITGSFLDQGFHFNDIDILLVTEEKVKEKHLKKIIEDQNKIKIHLIILSNKALIKGLETDPLYQMMISRCIAKKRFIYKVKTKFYYKILDLHLLKSNALTYSFDFLNGNEKYYLIRNTIAISLFLKHKKLNKESIGKEIKKIFNLENTDIIKNNMIRDKKEFLKTYKEIHKETFNKLMKGVKNSSKQE